MLCFFLVKRFSLYIHVYIHTYMYTYIFFSIIIYYRILKILACAISWTLLFIYFIYSGLCLLTPNSSNLSLPSPLLPVVTTTFVFYVCKSFSVSQICPFVSYFRLHISNIYGICLSLLIYLVFTASILL